MNLCIFVRYCISVVFCNVHSFSTFSFIVEIEKMARMFGNSNYVDLSDPIDSVSISSIVHPECSFVGVSSQPGVCWTPSIGKHILFCYCNFV